MSVPRVLAVDFDGTICDFEYPAIGKPKAGVREALSRFRQLGYHILIYSCRTSSYYPEYYDVENRPAKLLVMKEWLEKNGIPFDDIDDGTKGKPFADLYIDDKGFRFENNWPEVVKFVEEHVYRG